jgi:hypothetical protein
MVLLILPFPPLVWLCASMLLVVLMLLAPDVIAPPELELVDEL